MSPSLDGTLPEYVISQEDNSPLTLYTWEGNIHKINETFAKSYLLIGLSKLPKLLLFGF